MRPLGSWRERWSGQLSVTKRLFQFFWKERLWWMIPMVAVLLLLGLLLFVAQQSAVTPFIYTLF